MPRQRIDSIQELIDVLQNVDDKNAPCFIWDDGDRKSISSIDDSTGVVDLNIKMTD